MVDKIITELWEIKDDLSKEVGKDMKTFCHRLNEEAIRGGDVLVSRSHSTEMMVAEESAKYGTGNSES